MQHSDGIASYNTTYSSFHLQFRFDFIQLSIEGGVGLGERAVLVLRIAQLCTELPILGLELALGGPEGTNDHLILCYLGTGCTELFLTLSQLAADISLTWQYKNQRNA